MKVEFENKVAAYYNIQVIDSKTGKVKQKVRSKNRLVNSWSKTPGILQNSGYYSPPAFGTGTTPPTKQDRDLANRVYRANNRNMYKGMTLTLPPNSEAGNNTRTFVFKWNWEITAGQFTGNISEFGMFISRNISSANSNDHFLFSRALVTDLNGNPTTLTVTADDVVAFTYEIQLTMDVAPKAVTVDGVDLIVRPVNINNHVAQDRNLFISICQPYARYMGLWRTASQWIGNLNSRYVETTRKPGSDGASSGRPTYYKSISISRPSVYDDRTVSVLYVNKLSLNEGNFEIAQIALNTSSSWSRSAHKWIIDLVNPVTKTNTQVLDIEVEVAVTFSDA